ncbi:hypothetical protein H0H87_009585 [Tephrocybe sp. NHM501043]|nr:hypothetical protein H0H87_009585 [Tephrocybe sp. NHM501043]
MLYQGISDQIDTGIHENSQLSYHPIGNLIEINRRKSEQLSTMRLVKLNDSRKLLGMATMLDDHKQWILAVASGRVDRVGVLVQAGLVNKSGVRGLIRQYQRAVDKLYKPKGYTEDDIMHSIVMLRLGGARVAEFAHLAFSSPSVTTARRNAIIMPLLISHAKPTILKVESNISAFLDALPGGETARIIHQVLMLDEIAVEKQPRWDDKTDMFFGVCREHANHVPLEFSSKRELDLFCDALDSGEIHFASEVSYQSVLH